MTMKRRDAIKTLGALAGAASTASLVSACGDNVGEPGDNIEPGIDTFVFLMMENRSYDHYLGSRALLEGKPSDGLVSGMSNPDPEGNSVEIWPASAGTMCVLDPPHGWTASRNQLRDGTNDGFVLVHQGKHQSPNAVEPMQYMTREQLPVLHALADEYTSCDRWFSSVLGPTLPNRMYWHAGTSNGAVGNFDVLSGAFRGITSLYHHLDRAGIDWAYYYGDIPVLALMEEIELEGRLRRFSDFLDEAADGRLPPVVYIDPAFSWNDDHPPHHPLLGQQLISAIYQALATSPHWERCLLVVTYDEHGGFFDHVAPPLAADDFADKGFDQLGFRVPTVIAGPYVKNNHVSSVQYDHTSTIRHLETVFDLTSLTTRSANANDLSDAIDFERLTAGTPSDPVELPAIEIDELDLPDSCSRANAQSFDHDFLELAEKIDLGTWDLRKEVRDYGYGIAEYLDRHNLGRIRR